MAVAPGPVISLLSVVLMLVRTILAMPLHKIAPIGVIFAVVPIVIIVVMRVIDSNLNAGLRWCRRGYYRAAYR